MKYFARSFHVIYGTENSIVLLMEEFDYLNNYSKQKQLILLTFMILLIQTISYYIV